MRFTSTRFRGCRVLAAGAGLLLVLLAAPVEARIEGIQGPSFSLSARSAYISTPDGNSILLWGYADGPGPAQYPAPTLIVTQGDAVTVTLANEIPAPWYGGTPPNVSIVFPGQAVTATGGVAGLLSREAPPGGSVSYSFTAGEPGTYLYHSGTRPELQVEMGLIGALIVRPAAVPAGGAAGTTADHYAYDDAASSFDREALLLLSEMDTRIHGLVELGGVDALEFTDYLANPFAQYWFINGRAAPDTRSDSFVPRYPNQPYGSLMLVKPGERLLVRVIGGGRLSHPLQFQGNHVQVIARDGRLLSTGPGAGADLATSASTLLAAPGETVDAIFQWTGEGLGWDIYGDIDAGCTDANNDMGDDATGGPGSDPVICHDADCIDGDLDGFDDDNWEYCPDHGTPFPVILPSQFEATFGHSYAGSPFLGRFGPLPPGLGGLNPWGAYPFVVGSQNARELVNDNVPAPSGSSWGMTTMLLVVPPFTPLPAE